MDKYQLEIKLSDALDNGFRPKRIAVPPNAGPLTVIYKEGEDDRITVAFRTADRIGADISRLHTHQFIYTLDEVVELLKEYKS